MTFSNFLEIHCNYKNLTKTEIRLSKSWNCPIIRTVFETTKSFICFSWWVCFGFRPSKGQKRSQKWPSGQNSVGPEKNLFAFPQVEIFLRLSLQIQHFLFSSGQPCSRYVHSLESDMSYHCLHFTNNNLL